MTKEDVLQKVNEYCSEKSYTSETLTDDFRDKFSDFFAKKYPEETAIDAEGVLDDIKFNINTAFSATSKGVTSKQKAFDAKETEYKNQIAELNKKLGKKEDKHEEPKIPKELQDQLDELKKFKNEEAKKGKFKNIVDIAKASIRQDLHKSFETYAKDYEVLLDVEDKEQAKGLVARFQEIFKDSIGDIKPLAPKQIQKQEEDFLASIPKVKVV
jgi:hypothetical protein